jgi:hypothetical protein
MLGARVELYPCKGAGDLTLENQLFYLSGPIEVGDSTVKCLDLPPSSNYEGSTLQVYSCHGGDNQMWDYYFP